MRIAILSDIHANLPAFEAVLEDVEETSPDEIWCLGDVVGYGAQPDACAALAAERCSLCLVGNHDLAVLDELDLETFSHAAAAAVEWTQANSSEETFGYLRKLAPADTSREVSLYHASPRDPVWEYVLWPDQAAECMEARRRASPSSAIPTSPFSSPTSRAAKCAARRPAPAPSSTSARASG